MSVLTKLSVKRLMKQKFIYIFYLCFFCASFSYAFLISSPEMEERLNVDITIVSGANFPEFMLRFFVGIVGILFISFLVTFYICEEDRNGMLFQPLLHGKTREEIIKAKINVLSSMSFLFVVFICAVNYFVSYLRWGSIVFDKNTMIRVLIKYGLTGIYMVSVTLGIILACIYMRNTLKTLMIVITYFLVDAVLSALSIPIIKYIWIGQYAQEWLIFEEFQSISLVSAILGLLIIIFYGMLFYNFTMKKIKNISI